MSLTKRLVRLVIGVWICGLALSNAASAQATNDPLLHLRIGHPRLLMTDADVTAAKAAAKSDPLRAALNRNIIATAEFILTAPPVRQPDEELGQEQDRYAVYYILTEAMAYRLTGDARFLARAKSDLMTVAAFRDWDPRHSLSVGEMSFAASIGYDWLYAQLTPEERAALKEALLEKSLPYAMVAYGYRAGVRGQPSWSAKTTGNHNNVTNAGLLSGALAIADEEPELARNAIRGACGSMRSAMAEEYAPEGSYPEGPGYWTYATTYSAIAIAEMEGALGSDCGLSATPGFNRTVNFYEALEGPFGAMFNYADSSDDLQISPARTWMAKRFDASFAQGDMRAQLARYLAEHAVTPFDRGIQGTVINRFFALHEVWFPDAPKGKVADLPLDSHFSGVADIATFRTAWNDANAIFVGVKAGAVYDHHPHLDAGSFVMDADGQRWAMDLGPDNEGGSYTLPNYADLKGTRWTYFRTNNHSHNTVTPGDGLQSIHGTAPITKYGSGPTRSFAVVDLTPVYPGAAASLRRGVALLDRARVLVQDEYQPGPGNLPLHWVMVTKAKIEVAADGHSAILTSGGRSLRVELLEPGAAKLSIGSTKPQLAVEKQNEGTSMLRVDVSQGVSEQMVRVTVLLTPIGEKWPRLDAPTIKSLADW